jgi:hypothetical protein
MKIAQNMKVSQLLRFESNRLTIGIRFLQYHQLINLSRICKFKLPIRP